MRKEERNTDWPEFVIFVVILVILGVPQDIIKIFLAWIQSRDPHELPLDPISFFGDDFIGNILNNFLNLFVFYWNQNFLLRITVKALIAFLGTSALKDAARYIYEKIKKFIKFLFL